MAESAMDRLCDETGLTRAGVEALGELDEGQLDTLLAAYRNAAATRKTELETATDDGLKVIPRLIRPAVKRLLS
ncbi:hypothetical protein [Antrihabitans cavernicola]|uniref:Uncharacterized protein n=1 Tax=Antrihabitans cavernicola TaxID=2495913 RepID=A0A5A7SB32_9NOCA|nr:hypothetical protein [Spelaeibacter cavernicola]KAA0023338.1 hypothetical protein FOY51_07945 [Spelaeibacter cavernicola]